MRILTSFVVATLLITLNISSVTPQHGNSDYTEKETQETAATGIDYDLIASNPWKKKVPDEYKSHPEYGKTQPENPLVSGSYELINQRTANTRVFQNLDGSFTTVASSQPLHYKGKNDWWISFGENFDDELALSQNTTIVDDPSIIPSCFSPSFQQSSLTVLIPEDDLIINTYLSWEFTALNGGWTADQRSYAAGPGGETQLFIGSGNQGGTQVYTINTSIANGFSTGSVDIFFYAARVWGGSGCNTTYNYLNRRYIEIIHGEFQYGEGDVMINEYSASNRSMTDSYGNYEDWIEFFNPSENFVHLTGYYLSDNPNNPFKWQFPGGIIPPGGHLLVFCSGRDAMAGNIPHTNFRLTQLKPESIVFSDPDGVLLEQYTLFTTQNGHSVGRISSGDEEWGVFANPTPGSFNTQAKTGYAGKPVFSISAGFYNGSQTLEITTTDTNAVIRYTLNGHEPTTSSTVYTGPINLTTTTVVRSRVFSNNTDILPGFIETATFFINDPNSLPVFSFSGTQLLTLFGGTQIEPIGAFEFFDENGQFVDKSVGDFNKHGNDSWSYAQRGVDFISRDEYGYNRHLTHQFFPTTDRNEFQRLMVKAAANDNYPLQTGGAHVRDAYIQTLSQLSNLEHDERSSLFVSLYVNGQYWGVYDLREKVDDRDFTDYYYDQDEIYKGSPEYVQFLKTWGGTQPKYGGTQASQNWTALRNFVNNNNMAIQANYDYVLSQLDLESSIDYFVYNSLIVSRDWLNYNTGWWRGLDPAGGALNWRYILWDMDAAFGHYTNFTGLPNPTATAPPCQVENLTVGNGHAQILKKLIDQNSDARYRYVTRYIDLLNTHLSATRMIHVLDSMVDVIAPEMPRQIARWGGNMNTWNQNVQAIRNFILQREISLEQGLKDCYQLTGPYNVIYQIQPVNVGQIKMNSEWLDEYPFTAKMYGGIETRLEATSFAPYKFSHWEVTGTTVFPGPLSPAIIVNLSQNASVTAHYYNPLTDNDLVHYWHFNDLPSGTLTSVESDFSANYTGAITYPGTSEGYMDSRTHTTADPVSNLNLQMGQLPDQGAVLRVRNPSNTRELIIAASSAGYKELVVAFATTRTSNGAESQEFYWSPDNGANWTLYEPAYTVSLLTDWELKVFDLSSFTALDNNPDVQFRVLFLGGNASGASGNNRFDNLTVMGVPTVEPVTYYSKAIGPLESPGTWGTLPDGSGTSPLSFDTDYTTYKLRNRTTTALSDTWTVTGFDSRVVVGDGINNIDFMVDASFNAKVEVSNLAALMLSNQTIPDLVELHEGSVVIFTGAAQNVPYTSYHHLTFSGIDPIFTSNGAVTVGGNLNLTGSVNMPDARGSNEYSFLFTGSANQQINTGGNVLRSYNMLFVKTDGSVSFTSGSTISTDNQLTFNIAADAAFSDNGITIYAGNSVNIAGDEDSFLFTGTLILAGTEPGIVNGSDAGNNFNIRQGDNTNPLAQLNNLIVRVENTGGQFRFRDGTSNMFAIKGDFIVENGADGFIRFYDNEVIIGGNFSVGEDFSGSIEPMKSLTFNGTLVQNLELSSALYVQDLILDNSAGIINVDGTIEVDTLLSFVSGKMITSGDGIVIIGLEGEITGFDNQKFIEGALGFRTSKTTAQEFIYPIGKDGNYRPVAFEVSHPDNEEMLYVAEVFEASPPTLSLPPEIDWVSDIRYYRIEEYGDGQMITGEITLSYDQTEINFDPDLLRIVRAGDSGWEDLGGIATGSLQGSVTSTENFTATGIFALARAATGTTSAEHSNHNHNVSIYPNPAQVKFFVVSDEKIIGIRLIDISGQVIHKIAVNDLQAEITTNQFNAGIYIIQIRTIHRLLTERIVIIR